MKEKGIIMQTQLATRCIHTGEIDDAHGSPHTPIYTTTTFKFASTADLNQALG